MMPGLLAAQVAIGIVYFQVGIVGATAVGWRLFCRLFLWCSDIVL
jgi:hypothetical protein